MKRLAVYVGVSLLVGCRNTPEVCNEICERAVACGVTFSWLGTGVSDCGGRCGKTARADEELRAVFRGAADCAGAAEDDAGDRIEWCDNELFMGCADFVTCLERNVPLVSSADGPEAGGNVFRTRVHVRLTTGEIVEGSSFYHHSSDPLERLVCAPTHECFDVYDIPCAGDADLTPPRLTFGSFCDHFQVEALAVGLAARSCEGGVCTLLEIAQAEAVPCADLWSFVEEVAATFEDVRVGPVLPFVKFFGPTPSPPAPAEGATTTCWQVFGAPMVATRFDLGFDVGIGSVIILRLPDIAELEADPDLVSPCDPP